jgi:gliding motility-associated-like protein
MKKILLLILSVVFTNTIYSQTITGNGGVIDSVVISQIACNGDATSVKVYTNAVSNASYDLEIFSGIWMHHPSYPVVSGNSYVLTNLTAGTKRVIVEYPLNSSIFDTLEFTISQPDAIQNFTTLSNISCNGNNDGSISFTTFLGTAGYYYSLNGGAQQYNANGLYVLNNLSPGSYSLSISDVNGCLFSGNPIFVTLTQPNTLTASIQQTSVSCYGGNNGTSTVNPSGGTSPYSYLWSNGSTNQSTTGLTSGNYSCIITDANNCVVMQNIIVTQPSSSLTISSSTTFVGCNGGNNGTATVSVGGGSAGYSYLWSNGQNTPTAFFLISGNYNCTVTDANGCTINSGNIFVNQPSILTVSSSATAVSCYGGNNGTATVNPIGGTSPYSYSWSNGQNTQIASGLISGNYNCTITDANGCIINSGNIFVNQPSALSISSSVTPVSCNGGNNGTATVTAGGGVLGYSYSWSNGSTNQSIAGLTSGNYSCTITDANNCSIITNVFVSEPNQLALLSTTINDVSCNGGSDGDVTILITGGTQSYVFLWSTGATVNTLTNLTAGTYTCDIIDANGCAIPTISVTVNEPTSLFYSINTNIVSCKGGSDGSAAVYPNGGTAPYNYLWSTGSSIQTITNLSAGNYTCTITDANGCTTQIVASVPEPPTYLLLTTDSEDVSCNGGNDGSVSVSAGGGSPGYTYLWSNLSSDTLITALISGNYTISVTDANNCTVIQNIYINEPLTLTIPIVATDVSCNGGSDAIATAFPSGGTSPYSFSWNTSPVQTTQSATGLSANVYTVTVIDSINCPSVSSSVTINEPALISAIAVIDSVSCFGGFSGQITLSVSGGNGNYTYLWSDGQTTQNAIGLVAGNYTVEILDSTNCRFFDTYDVYEPSNSLVSSATVTDVSCFGFSDGIVSLVTTGGTPNYSYSWDNGQDSQSLTGLSIGTYTCTVTDYNGCIAFVTATVGQPLQLNLTSSSLATSCFGDSDGSAAVVPQGGTGSYTYNWSNGQTTQQAINLIAGTYSIMVLDGNSCATSASVTVGQPVQVGAVLTPINILCNGDSTGNIIVNNVIGTTGPYIYSWSDGHDDPINQNLSAGTYYVTITDGNGCSNTFSQSLTQPLPITATLSYSDISVNGAADGSISAIVSGGNSPYTYSWSGPNNYSNSNSSINSLEMGLYTLIITDASSCSQTFNQVINQPNCNVIITETYTAPLCYGNMATVYWQNSGGLAPYSNTLISSDGTVLINGAQYNYPNTPLQFPSGVYDLVVEDASGCSAIWNIQITTPESIELNLSLTDALCYNGSTGTASVVINGGIFPYNTNWGGADPNLLIAGNYNIQVMDANGCSSGIINYTINEPSQLVINSVNTTLVSCSSGNNGTATTYGSGGILPYTYGWSNGQTTQIAQSLANGTYTAYLYDANNCQAIFNNVQITNAPLLNVSIQQIAISCTGESDGALVSTVVTGTGPITYNWYNLTNPNTVISSDPSVSNLSSGAYSLIATDINGCIDQGSILLVNPATISFGLNPNDITSNGANNGWINTVSVSGGQSPYTYYWIGSNGFSAISQNLTNLSIGTYTLTITDANGCTSSQSTVINQTSCNVTINNTINQPLCFGDYGNVVWTNSGGGGNYTNTITNLNTNAIIYNSFTSSSVQLSVGSYALQVSDQYGCVDLVNIQITEPDALIANTSTTATTCFGGNDGSVSITPQGGTPTYNITGLPNPNSLSPGTYTYILTDANSCSINQSFSISEPSDIITTISSTNVSCLGGNDGTATVNINGGTGPYTYNWSPSGFNTQTVTSLDDGNHYVLITDAFGCNPSAGQNLVVITEPSFNLAATFTTSDVSCFSFSDGTAQIFPTGGTAPYTYLWSNGQIMHLATTLVADNYSCTVTDANGCSDLFTTTINEPLEILANISVTDVSCNGTADGSAVVNPSGGSGIYNVNWFNGATNLIVTGLQIGSYNVTVTDNLGCNTIVNTITFVVGQPSSLTLNTAVIVESTCLGNSDGSVNVTATGGSSPYSYNWLDLLNTTLSTDSFAINLGAATYRVIVSDVNGCFDTASVLLTLPDTIVANISTNPTLCNGSSDGSAMANPTGGTAPYTYLWTGSGSTSATSNGLNAATTYYVSIVDANGCNLTAVPFSISEPDVVSINFTLSYYNGFNVSCNNSSDGFLTISASGGNGPYDYSDDGIYYPNVSDSTFLNLSSGWFTSYVKDSNECVVSDSIEVIAPDILDPNITILNNVSCIGANDGVIASIIQGGAGSFSYLWSNLGVNDSIAGLSEGFYSVEVTDLNGCTEIDTITLLPSFVLSANSINTTISCTGLLDGTALQQPTGGTAPYTYLWNNGNTSANIQGLGVGMYWCTITDNNGCEITDTVQITQSATSLSIIKVEKTDISCNGGNDGLASIFVTGGTQPYNFLWSDVNMQTTPIITNLYADTFIVSVTDNSGCTVYDTIIINEPSQLNNILVPANISCYGFSDGILVNTTLGGTLPYAVNWQGPNNYSSNLDSIADLGLGEYIITIEDSNMCSVSDTFTITEPLSLSYLIATYNPLCFNDDNGIIDIEINGGTQPYDAMYGSGVNSYPTNDSIIITGLSAGDDTLYVIDANGCAESNFVNLIVPLELLIDNITEISPTCYGYSDGLSVVTVIGGALPYTYELLDDLNNLAGNTYVINSLDAGSYTFIVTDLNGCLVSSEVNLINPDEIEISLLESCYGSLLVDVLNTNGNYQIFWDNALDSVYIDGLEPGLYNVTVIDDLGCTRTDSFTINGLLDYTIYDASCQSLADGSIEVHNINGGYPPFSVIVNGELLAEDIVNSILIDDLFASTNQITLVDAIGCELSDTITVDYIGGYNCIEVPVVVSPNNDGTNDSWHPIFDIDVDIEVIILNRWGEEEFYYSGNSLAFEWNGLATNGDNLPSTDYYYIIKFNDNNYPDMTGVITLIR